MSMYEVEDLIESTIHMIDRADVLNAEKRNLIWNAYRIQMAFDCSHTYSRVSDILNKYDYLQYYPLQSFPLYNQHPDFYSKLFERDFEWLYKDPLAEWGEEDQIIGHWDKKQNAIIVDFGSDYYNLHPENSKLIEPLAYGLNIIKMAKDLNDQAIVYNWSAFLIVYVMQNFPSNKDTVSLKHEYFNEISNIYKEYDFTDHETLHFGLDFNNLKSKTIEWLSDKQIEILELF